MAASLSLQYTRNSQSIENNSTNVTIEVWISWTYGTWNGYTMPGTLTIDGTAYSFSSSFNTSASTSGSQKIFEKTVNVAHNADGNKTLSYSASFEYHTGKTITASGAQNLPLIARASQPSCITWPEHTQQVGSFGDTISIHTNRASSALTHTLRYQFGSSSGTIATGVTNGTTWTIPLTLMNLIPNATSGSGTIYCDTYSGSTLVGTRSCGFTATVPASVKPTCSMTLEDVTGVDDIYGSPVQALSQIKVTVSARTAYSSPIASYTIEANGATYSGAEATTGTLQASGSSVVRVTVKDKRGRTGTASYTMSVQAYTPPAVSGLVLHRCDADGTANEEGEYIQVAFSAAISSMSSKNTAAYALRYKKTTASSYTTHTFTDLANQYTVTNQTYIFAADTEAAYDIEVTATDRHSTTTRATTGSTAFTLMDWHHSGTGIAFGKVAQKENTMEVALAAEFSADVSGMVYGLGGLPAIPENADLNLYLTPGVFGVQATATAGTLQNIPIATAGRLIVSSSNGAPITSTTRSHYWEQRYIPLDYGHAGYDKPTYIRYIFQEGTDSVTYLPWFNEALKAYPIGSIYLAYNHTNPATLFGGTWARIQNAFLWAVDDTGRIGLTGGEHTVTLTEAQMPVHNHGGTYTNAGTARTHAWLASGGSAMGYDTVEAGGGEAHNNMPPYIQVSVWRRTA